MTELASRYLWDLTRPQIEAQIKRNPLVLLPAGSIEQHGPHLPTGTDTFAAQVISHAVAERMDGLVLPWTPLGVTPMHAVFPGTITLSPDTYMRIMIETGASLARHGAKRLLVVNWHEGNSAPISIAAEALHREHGLSVVTCHACYVAADLYGPTSGGLTHGGEIEALAVLAYRPDLVHLDRVAGSSDAALGHKMDKLRRTRSYQPVLTDIRLGKATVPALISISKTGQAFMLDRRTGKPLAGVVEKPVPQGGAPGERLSPTQPFSVGMPHFSGDRISEAQMWGLTPLDQLWCRIRYREARDDIEADLAEGGVRRTKECVTRAKSSEARCKTLAASGRSCVTEVQRYYMKRRSELGLS